jgi:ribosomal protein S18 acetylase RimI-like enzyme
VGHWNGEPHIGTFVQPGLQAKGIGGALFSMTLATLRQTKIGYIIAWIRADNVPGLAYYRRIGFRDIGSDPDFALADGRKVGRIYRRFDV